MEHNMAFTRNTTGVAKPEAAADKTAAVKKPVSIKRDVAKKAAAPKPTAETIDKLARAEAAAAKEEIAELKAQLNTLQSKLAKAHKAAESGRLGSGIVNVFKNLR